MEKQIKNCPGRHSELQQDDPVQRLTGSNQFVGNWWRHRGEKEGKLKKHDNVVIMDLPGIYSCPLHSGRGGGP